MHIHSLSLSHARTHTPTHARTQNKNDKCLTTASLALGLWTEERKRDRVRWWVYWRSALGFSKWRRERWVTPLHSPNLILARTHFPGYYNVSVCMCARLGVCVCVCAKWNPSSVMAQMSESAAAAKGHMFKLSLQCSPYTKIYMFINKQTHTHFICLGDGNMCRCIQWDRVCVSGRYTSY